MSRSDAELAKYISETLGLDPEDFHATLKHNETTNEIEIVLVIHNALDRINLEFEVLPSNAGSQELVLCPDNEL